MSDPNFYPPDVAYHCTGYFREGRFFSPPRSPIIDAFLTICAKASSRYDVGISAWALMGSHPHIMVFDRNPDGPSQVWRFKKYVHGVFAQWLNWHWDTSGKIFDANVISQQFAIIDVDEEINQINYIENNMLAAGVLDPHGDFAGAVSRREYLLRPIAVTRPTGWFQARTWPDVAVIKLEVPPIAASEGHTAESWYAKTTVALYLSQMELLEERIRERKPFRSVDEVLSANPKRPRNKKVSHKRIPSTGSEKRGRARFYCRRRRFLRNHRRCRERLRGGEENVVFPWGTCKMVCTHGFPMNPSAG